MDLGLSGRVALVTGAARPRSIGRAVALTLASEGADVACVDLRIEEAESVAGEIREMGRRAVALQVDQSVHSQVRDCAVRVREALGPVDILMNCAGINSVGLLNRMDPSDWERTVDIDLSGPYYWTRELFGSMVKRRWGRIVTIASIAGVLGGAGQAGYAASKGGLVSLMKTAALEGARFGVTANAVSPGIVDTDMLSDIRADMRERITKRVGMGRPGEAQDVADLAAFLASDRARYITGENILVDGGLQLFVV